MELSAYITACGENGKPVYRVKAQSFVGNMAALLRKTINDATQAQNYTDTFGFNGNFPNAPPSHGCKAGANIDRFGIQIGDSAQLVDINDYALINQLYNVSVTHGLTSISALVTVGETETFTITRTFSNVGPKRTIREISLVANITGVSFCLMDRSVVKDYKLAMFASVSYTYEIGITL